MHIRFLALFFCLLFVGCGGQKELKHQSTYPVKGRVLYNDKPARFVFVRFQPVKGGVEATGRTDGENW